jgi:protein TonB
VGADVPVVVVEPLQADSPDFDQKGSVRLKYTVLPDGSVLDIVVVESNPPGTWDSKAIEQLKQWKHQPGLETETREMAIIFLKMRGQCDLPPV